MSTRIRTAIIVLLITAGCTASAEEIASENRSARARYIQEAQRRDEPEEIEAEEEKEQELAPYMAELQRFSQKLGYAIHARNLKLSQFYLEELKESLASLEQIPEHNGMPIAQPAKVILAPLVTELDADLAAGSWKKTASGYANLINGCNRCHTATEHEFIKILPAAGTPPYNQDFSN